jgi:hypothetical protein
MKSIARVPGVLSLTVAILVVFPAPADETAPVPDRAATLHFRNGKTVTGILKQALSRSVLLRRSASTTSATIRYEAKDIRWIESRGNYFAQDEASGEWKIDPQGGKDREKLQAKEKGGKKPAAPAGRGGDKPATVSMVQVVEAEGSGATVEEARKDAIRAAVRKAAGALVLEELTAENDRVIKDKVLIYSDGVLASDGYKELKRKRDGEIWTLQISARVISRKLAERLLAVGLATREVDGESLAAAVLSRDEARKRGAELVQNVLDELRDVLAATAAKPTARDYEDGELRISVQVSANAKQYKRWLVRSSAVLHKVCLSRMSRVAAPARLRISAVATPLQSLNAQLLEVSRNNTEEKSWFLWLLSASGPGLQGTSWWVFKLDCPRDRVAAALAKKPTLQVSLLEAEGKVIAKKTVELPAQPERVRGTWLWADVRYGVPTAKPRLPRGTTGKQVLLAPLRIVPASFGGLSSLAAVENVEMKIALSEEELGRLKRVDCAIVWE